MTTSDFGRSRWWSVICLSVAVAVSVAGCTHSPGHSPGGAMWSRLIPGASKSRMARKDEKASSRLQLAYAQWQEQVGSEAEARESYERVIEDDPKSVDAILGLARLDQLAGRSSQAEQRFVRALRLKPHDPAVLHATGQFYASQERWDEAIGRLNAAMLGAPANATYRYHFAVALARSGDLQGAMPHFVRTVGDAEAHYNLGYILYEKGDFAAAEQQFLQAALKRPDLNQAQVMLDEVRQTQESRLMLAGSSTNSPRIADTAPSPRPARPPSGMVRPAVDEDSFSGSKASASGGAESPLSMGDWSNFFDDSEQPDISQQQREQWKNQMRAHAEEEQWTTPAGDGAKR